MASLYQSRKKQFIIVEGHHFLPVQSPLKSTQRIKYTCFDISQNYIVFGATSGGLYVFQREPCEFLELLPNKEGCVNNVVISPDEKMVAFSTTRGIACVVDYNEEGGKLVNKSLEHNGSTITFITWAENSYQVFIGDYLGRLSVINISNFLSKNIFQMPTSFIMKLDSGIVQMSCRGENLLVSTQTKCYICDTVKEQYKPIGNKLRQGNYGACFFNSSDDCVKVFCARPGSRLWEADLNGTVISTHQFKQALATEPSPFLSLESNELFISSNHDWPEQSLNFSYLTTILDKFIFSFSSEGIYIFDPEQVNVLLWSNHYKDIQDAKCLNDSIYLWTQKGDFYCLLITPLLKCLLNLYYQDEFETCIRLCERFASSFQPNELANLTPLLGLKENLMCTFSEELNHFFDQVSRHSKGIIPGELDSGIFLIENRHLKWKQGHKSAPVQDEPRSHSLPPESLCLREERMKAKTFCSNTSSSLPDLNFLRNEDKDKDLTENEVDTILIDDYPNLTFIFDSNCDGYFIPQLPFISFSSPDVINNAIVELGQNVSGKIYSGTRRLIDKWQVLEGKFRFLKVQNNSNEEEISVKPSEDLPVPIELEDEDIVSGRKKCPTNHAPTINVTSLLELCADFEKQENGKKAHVIYHLLECVIKANDDYYKSLVNESKNTVKKIFPFSQCLSGEDILVIQKIFHEALKSEHFIKYLQRLQGEQLVSNCHLEHPKLLKKIFSECDLNLDCILSNIIYIFSELLDPFIILQCLDETKLPCTFMSWCVVLETFQESAFNYITSNNNSSNVEYTDWPLPLLLNSMYLMFRLDQVDPNVVMMSKRDFGLYNISYLLLKLAIHLESTGMTPEESSLHCNQLMAQFLIKLEKTSPLEEKELENLVIFNHFEELMYESQLINVPVCKCSYPFQGSATPKFKYSPIAKLLFNFYWNYSPRDCSVDEKSRLIFGTQQTNQSEIFETKCVDLALSNICITKLGLTYSYLKLSKILRLLKTVPELVSLLVKKAPNKLYDLIPFVVQFGQVSAIDEFVPRASYHVWENICSQIVKVTEGECVLCFQRILHDVVTDWNRLSVMILKSLGPSDAIKILSKFSEAIPTGGLDIRFHRTCLFAGLLDSENMETSGCLIENYYKSITKRNLKDDAENNDNIHTWEADSSDSQSPEIVYSKDRKHWGITLDVEVDACSRCSLPLNSEKLIEDGGLRAFKCRHVYHVVCLRLCQSPFNCPLCG